MSNGCCWWLCWCLTGRQNAFSWKPLSSHLSELQNSWCYGWFFLSISSKAFSFAGFSMIVWERNSKREPPPSLVPAFLFPWRMYHQNLCWSFFLWTISLPSDLCTLISPSLKEDERFPHLSYSYLSYAFRGSVFYSDPVGRKYTWWSSRKEINFKEKKFSTRV